MAENKNKIVVYSDWKDSFEHLTDEEAGKLIKHFFSYVNDENPVLKDRLLIASWLPIQKTLKRDLKKWEGFIEKQKANGKKGGRPKTQKTQAFIKKPKKAVSVSVSDSDITINSYIEEISKSHQYLEGLYRLYKLEKGSASKLLDDFKNHLKMNPKEHSNFSEFRSHFNNWVGVKDRNNGLSKYKRHQKGDL